MTEITKTSIKIHSSGDQTKVVCDASNIQNGYTATIPHISVIEDWVLAPTTEADWGASISGNTLTFATSTTIAGKLTVYGR